MEAPSRKKSPNGKQNRETDPFWSAVRANIAFRDDEAVQREWESFWYFRIVSRTTPMRIVLTQAESLIRSRANVLIQGPPGSPRMEIARIIHDASHETSTQPCVCNCAGAKLSTASATLAKARKLGMTLIIQHVDKADTSFQHTLLGFLEALDNESGVSCIGIATNDLAELTAAGNFDSDLLTHLNYDRRIIVPSLKDHRWDIVPNVVSRLLRGSATPGIRHITYAALVFLREYDWPGDLRQLNELIDGLQSEAADSGETVIRLEQMINWFRHVVPPCDTVKEERNVSARFHRWEARLGSVEMATLFTHQFNSPDKNDRPEMGGWDKFEKKEGYCPILFAADIGVGTLVCDLRLRPLYASRRWLVSEKNPNRRGWKKLLVVAENDRTCEITVESADTEILFDLQKMARDLSPFLVVEPPGRMREGSSRNRTQKVPARDSDALPSRRHPKRDWRIRDEVSYCYRRVGFGSLTEVCKEVAGKWENISGRRVRNIYYELAHLKRPSGCTVPPLADLAKRYPQYTRPEMG